MAEDRNTSKSDRQSPHYRHDPHVVHDYAHDLTHLNKHHMLNVQTNKNTVPEVVPDPSTFSRWWGSVFSLMFGRPN